MRNQAVNQMLNKELKMFALWFTIQMFKIIIMAAMILFLACVISGAFRLVLNGGI